MSQPYYGPPHGGAPQGQGDPSQPYGLHPPQPSYPPQPYYPPQQPMQPMGYQQAPEAKEEKSHGCLYTCIAAMCCCWLCGETCECCLECFECCC